MTGGGADRGTRDERGYTPEELWAAAGRRAPVALIVAAAAAVVGLVGIFAMSDEYRAEATIILEPYRPHAELVTPAVTTLFEDRLRVARQQLLARPVLERVVFETGVFADRRAKHGLDAAVEALRGRLEVHPDGDSAMVVTYRTPRRDEAAKVVTAVARGFVDANAALRTGQAERVLSILTDELAGVQGRLDTQEAKVRDFRLGHDGELPEQMEANLREAERATRLLDSTQAYLRELERRRALATGPAPTADVTRLGVVETDLLRQLNHARILYSPEHPEPVRLERELEGIRALKAQAEGMSDTSARERASIGRELSRARRDAAALEAKIAQARDRAGAAAKWGAQLSVLERDRDLLREKYRSLLSRRVEGEVSLSLERAAAPHATRIVSPAADPLGPSAPDRRRLALVVLALALGLGVAAGVVLESRDGSVRTPAEARAQGVPLLAVVPTLDKGE